MTKKIFEIEKKIKLEVTESTSEPDEPEIPPEIPERERYADVNCSIPSQLTCLVACDCIYFVRSNINLVLHFRLLASDW